MKLRVDSLKNKPLSRLIKKKKKDKVQVNKIRSKEEMLQHQHKIEIQKMRRIYFCVWC